MSATRDHIRDLNERMTAIDGRLSAVPLRLADSAPPATLKLKVGIVTSEISAASGTVGGTITVGSGNVQSYSHSTGNDWVGGATETWKNWMHGTVAVNSPVIGAVMGNGDTFVIAAGCVPVPLSS